MTYTDDDLDEIRDSISQLVLSIETITEDWRTDRRSTAADEIAEARQRLDQIETISRTARRELRVAEVRARVRSVWSSAFAAGDVPDHEDDDEYRHLYDLLTPHGIAEMLVRASEAVDPTREESERYQVLEHSQDIAGVRDQVMERILTTEGSTWNDTPDSDDELFADPRWKRAEKVIIEFVDALYTEDT
ncbi:hypothetical protein [Nocardiopsis sp. NPDC006938]|uniref:hypothetical protein n=1 Tax=Nocardiopsis sp. NPDC006938 TaxID=3364337 RepID=UPI0036B4D4EE